MQTPSRRPAFIEGFAPPIPNAPFSDIPAYAASLKKMLRDLEASERMPPEKLKELQATRLRNLLAYAMQHSPHAAKRMKEHGINPTAQDILAELQKLPPLTRRDIQENQQNMLSRQLYSSHGPVAFTQTSGSSGEPVKILRTALTERFWQAFTMREHLWHKRDFSQNIAVFRAILPSSEPATFPGWGPPAGMLFPQTGKGHAMLINRPVAEQAAWLATTNAAYLTVYPSNLSALLEELQKQNIKLQNLQQIRTIGETLPDTLRTAAERQLGAKVVDVYSSQEVGTIAIQCPDSAKGCYHIMAEGLLVEVLDDKGQPCAEGQAGRVVVTDLVNYAMPLLRYTLGDHAVQGGACGCGRNLPTLRRVLGRERNMAVHNGQRFWPKVGFAYFQGAAPVRQYQIIQHTEQKLEMRLVTDRPLTTGEEQALRNILTENLGFGTEVSFTYFQGRIPPKANGKFEEFVCLID